MEQLGGLILQVLAVSAGCSVVLGPLLVLAPRMRRKVAARSFYVLFLLLALRLVLPVEVKLPAPVVTVSVPETVTVPAARPAAGLLPAGLPAGQAPETGPAPAARKIPLLQIAGTVWAAGAAVCALWSAGGYALARRRLLRHAARAEDGACAVLERLRGELRVRRRVGLYRSGYTATALTLGLFVPVVVLPARPFTGEELELSLRHELTHIRRWDLAYKLVLSLACWVNWFNPLVWLMDRAAERNLELCCDDEVTRDLSAAQRRRYGTMLLDVAEAGYIPFSTSFSGGKEQMKERLLNLFTKKRNSAALVCLVLAAALLVGGLVAVERAGATTPAEGQEGPHPSVSLENAARRNLLKDYFYANVQENEASVVLADLTGDGLDEMLVLTLHTTSDTGADLRRPVSAEQFAYGGVKIYGEKDGAVFQYNSIADVSNSHAGWGYLYLVPRPDGDGSALLHYSPYIAQGSASYTYKVCGLEGLDELDEWLGLDGGEVYFSTDPVGSMDPDTGDEATLEEAQEFLDRVQGYRDSGVPLLCFYSDGAKNEFSYLNAAPAEAFAGKFDTLSALRGGVVSNGCTAQVPLPPAAPATPEEAMDRLEASVEAYPDGYVFRIPNYRGEWNVHIAGRMAMEWASHPADTPEMFMAVHYLEDEQWKPGKRYSFDTEGAHFSELTLTASVTSPDGKSAERSIVLAGPGEDVDSTLPEEGNKSP